MKKREVGKYRRGGGGGGMVPTVFKNMPSGKQFMVSQKQLQYEEITVHVKIINN